MTDLVSDSTDSTVKQQVGTMDSARGLFSKADQRAYNGCAFIELAQPVSGQSMFHDCLSRYPAGGTQHMAFRLSVSDFDRISGKLREQDYTVIGEAAPR